MNEEMNIKLFLRNLGMYVVSILGWLILGLILIVGLEKLPSLELGSEAANDILKMVTAIGGTLTWIAWAKIDFVETGRLKNFPALWFGVLVGVLSILSFFAAILPFHWLQTSTVSETLLESLIASLIGSIVAGLSEEMIFRGVIHSLFRMVSPLWLAALVNSILFAGAHILLNHYDSPAIVLPVIIVAGLLLTLAWEIKGLWYAIGIHIGLDFAIGKVELFTTNSAPGWAMTDGSLKDWIPLLVLAVVLLTQQGPPGHPGKEPLVNLD